MFIPRSVISQQDAYLQLCGTEVGSQKYVDLCLVWRDDGSWESVAMRLQKSCVCF